MAKRGSKVERPIARGEWTPKFDNNAAAKAWRDLVNQREKSALARFWNIVVADPRAGPNPARHHRLKGELATVTRGGRRLEQWQHEISGGGRIWFLIDDASKTVWVNIVSPGHPSKTD
jgi:hypothetical protein